MGLFFILSEYMNRGVFQTAAAPYPILSSSKFNCATYIYLYAMYDSLPHCQPTLY